MFVCFFFCVFFLFCFFFVVFDFFFFFFFCSMLQIKKTINHLYNGWKGDIYAILKIRHIHNFKSLSREYH